MDRFSLGQLLAFVFALCVYFAVLTIPTGVMALAAWMILAIFYYKWRLPLAFTVHGILPWWIVILAFPIIWGISWDTHSRPDEFGWVQRWVEFAVFIGRGSSALSFPIAILSLLTRPLRGPDYRLWLRDDRGAPRTREH